jgi:hypothetical protein
MKNFIKILLITSFTTISLFAMDGKSLAKDLGLNASFKAAIQWNKVFLKKRKMKKLGIDKLNSDEKDALKKYLVAHAADSDSPEVAGI